MWRDAVLVAGKDLRIELRSRVVLHQVAPFAVLVLVLFAFALGPDRGPVAQAAPGLFWVAVLFASVLAVQRSFALESADGARDGLRLSGLDPAGVFLGKTAAVARAAGRPRGGAHRRRGRCSTARTSTPYGSDRRGRRWPARPAWPRRAPSTGRSPRGCGSARRCCRSCSCPWWRRCCWPGRGRGRRRSGSARRRARRPVGPAPARVRGGLPRPRGRHLRAPAGGVVSAPTHPAAAPLEPARHAGCVRGARDRRLPLGTGGATVWLGLWVTPPDQVQGNLVRLVYVHPPIAWVALYLAFGMAARVEPAVAVAADPQPLLGPAGGVGGGGGRRLHRPHPRHRARSGAGRRGACGGPGTPGSPRRRCCSCCCSGTWRCAGSPADPDARARRCAVVALVAAVDVPIVHFSVDWWHTLHQGATVLNANLSPTIHGSMAWTLLLGFVAFTLLFAWMLAVRYRVEVLSEHARGRRARRGAARAVGRGRPPSASRARRRSGGERRPGTRPTP